MRSLLIRSAASVAILFLTLLVVDRAFGAINGPVVKPVNAMGITSAPGEAGTRLRPGFTGRYRNAEFSVSISINSRGLRGDEIAVPKPSGTFRMLALGDSFTFGQGVEVTEAWPALVDEAAGPDLDVVNAGWAAGSPVGHLRWLRSRGAELGADLIVLAVFVGNDVVEDLAERHAGSRPLDRIEYESRWLQNLQIRVGPVGFVRDAADALFPNLYELATLAVVRTQYLLGSHRPHFDYLLAEDEAPDLAEGWRMTIGAIDEIASEAALSGARFAMVIVPFYDQVADTPYPAGFRKDRPQSRLLDHCSDVGLECLDLLPALRAAGAPSSLYYLKDGHWTARGQRVASDAVIAWLRERRLIPR